ncbi:GNAT family N-acetyltransferase [Brevibacillus ginsengisoli]|uniref:GNAT family N-acetyltransferase n=1 Tax=Brevibacillus ginsengisoli TaxID=363854 RepID=UPI003CEE077B
MKKKRFDIGEIDILDLLNEIGEEVEESEQLLNSSFKPNSFDWNLVQQLSHGELESHLRNINIIDQELTVYAVERTLGNEFLILTGYSYDMFYIRAVIVKPDNSIKFVGICAKEMSDNRLHILDINVKKKDANKGYGSILLAHLIKVASNNSVRTITGELTPEDLRSHGDRLKYFYKKHGFEIEDFGHFANIKWTNSN